MRTIEDLEKVITDHIHEENAHDITRDLAIQSIKESLARKEKDDAPSNAVLLAKLDSMSAVVLANQASAHEANALILTQTTKTNGRVTSLEKTKWMFMGGLIFINIIIVPVALAAINRYFK